MSVALLQSISLQDMITCGQSILNPDTGNFSHSVQSTLFHKISLESLQPATERQYRPISLHCVRYKLSYKIEIRCMKPEGSDQQIYTYNMDVARVLSQPCTTLGSSYDSCPKRMLA